MILRDNKIFLDRFAGVLIFNVLTFGIGLIISIYIPYKISIEEYAFWKEFDLAFAFAGVLNIGLVDGFYLLWGGKRFNEISKYLLYNMAVVTAMTIITVPLYLLIIHAIWPGFKFFGFLIVNSILYNAFGYFVNVFNSISRHAWANWMNFLNKLIFFIMIIILSQVIYARAVISIYTFSYLIIVVTVILVLLFTRSAGLTQGESGSGRLKDIILTVRSGLPLLLSNIAFLFIFNIDLAFVRIFADDRVFAFYGFSVTIIKALLLIAGSTKTVLFPIISNDLGPFLRKNEMVERRMFYISLILSAILSGIISQLLQLIIPKYYESSQIISVLSGEIPFMFIVISLQTTVFMARRAQMRLFYLTLIGSGLTVLACLPGLIYAKPLLIAYGMVLSSFLIFIIFKAGLVQDGRLKILREIVLLFPVIVMVVSSHFHGTARFIFLFLVVTYCGFQLIRNVRWESI